MKNHRHAILSCGIAAFLSLGIVGCSHSKPSGDETSSYTSDLGSSDEGKAYGLQTVHFSLDSSLLDDGAKAQLTQNAEALKSHSELKIQIEGHCDERGGIQYNIALGERRASSVMHFMEDLGIARSRMTTISYGKERPLVSGNTEDAYAKNRRANFVLTAK